MRIGFIGVGGNAQAHLRNLKGFEDVQVVGVTDKDEAKAAQVASELDAVAYKNADELFRGARLDAVYISIPPFAHGEPEWAAIKHKVPFYVEKPLGIDIEFAETLAERVAAAGLLTAVGFQLRYLETAEILRQQLHGRTIGLVTAHYACPMVQTPWWRQRELSGGQLVEQAIHIVDLIRYITEDDYATVHSQAVLRIHKHLPDTTISDATVTTFTFKSGALGALNNTCALPSGFSVGIDVVADGLAAKWQTQKLIITDADGPKTHESDSNAMALADRAFIDAVKADDPSLVRSDVPDALLTQRAVIAAVQSADQNGKTVVLP